MPESMISPHRQTRNPQCSLHLPCYPMTPLNQDIRNVRRNPQKNFSRLSPVRAAEHTTSAPKPYCRIDRHLEKREMNTTKSSFRIENREVGHQTGGTLGLVGGINSYPTIVKGTRVGGGVVRSLDQLRLIDRRLTIVVATSLTNCKTIERDETTLPTLVNFLLVILPRHLV